MPAIETKRSAGKPLDKFLQDVLDTKPNEWNYFFQSDRIKEVFLALAKQVQSQNFFIADYSINIFLDFLKTYVKAEFTVDKLKTIDNDILQKFNQLCMALQSKIVGHTTGLDESQQTIVGNYLSFLRQLMEHERRSLFVKSEIKLDSTEIEAIASMLTANSASINDILIKKYISLLRLSFDVPKFLVKYEAGLNILSLAKACFLNKAIDIHVVTTQFFYLLAYQGQLLDYYSSDSRFGISKHLLTTANNDLKHRVLDLQTYFFNHLQQRKDIKKELLQHYLYIHFFKVIYKKYPEHIEALKTDQYLSYYIKLDYVALPNSIDCRDYLSADNKVIIEYKNLITGIPEIACQAIACSSKSYEQWQGSLGFHSTSKSHYTFRIGDSYENYTFTYAYGYAPTGGGFYIAGDHSENIVNGIGYSYWGNDTHNFIDVTRHEAIHHNNFRLYLTALESNPNITSFTNRNFNEGLAVLFAGGACAPGYRSQDFSNIAAPSLKTLLNNEYIGYSTSWLYNNYLIQTYPDFYRELLSSGKNEFNAHWTPILNRDQQHFLDWLSFLNQTCQNAPKELSVEACPSIYLNDYLPGAVTKPVTTTMRLRRNTETMPEPLTAKVLNADEMGRQLIFKISKNQIADFKQLLQDGANPDYRENGNTPLHYLYFYGNCDKQYLELLLLHHAKISTNNAGLFPYQMAEKTCNATQLQTIKAIFSRYTPTNLNITTPEETGLIPYQQKKLAITIAIPISSLVSGIIAGGWDEISERHNQQYPYLPNLISYGLQPASLAMGNAIMNTLVVGPAEAIDLEDAWLSFAYYLGMNYFGMMLAQLGEKATKKIQNKLLNFLMPVLLYTFFLNPSLLVTLLSEGLEIESLQAVMMPLLSMISSGMLFKVGEYSTQKVVRKFFSENSAIPANDSKRSYLGYSLAGTPKGISSDQKTLEKIQKKLNEIKIEKYVDPQAYELCFKNNLESARANISTLLDKINKSESEINRELYRFSFNELEQNLINIQKLLKQLSNGKANNIKNIWKEISNVLVSLRGIRPLPQAPLERNYFFPPPPTAQEFLEMEAIKDGYSPGMA